MAQDLELVGGVKTLNPQPSDPRSRRNTIAEVQGDATYYKGYPDIYIVDEDKHYRITGGSVGAWVLESVIPEAQVIDVSTLEAYDPLQAYEKAVYRSYVNLASPNTQFQSPGIYLSMAPATAGQTPETHPYNPITEAGIWWYLGEKVTVSNRTTSNSIIRSTTELRLIESPVDGDTVSVSPDLAYEMIYKFDSESMSVSGIRPSTIPSTDPGRWEIFGARIMNPLMISYSYGASFPAINLSLGVTNLKITAPVDPFIINILPYIALKTTGVARALMFELIIDNTENSADINFTIDGPGDVVWGSEGELLLIKAGQRVKYSIISGMILGSTDINYINHDGASTGGSSGHMIKNSTQSFSQRTGLKFIGNVIVTDSEEDDETVVEVKGGDEAITGELSWSGSLWQISMLEDKVFRRLINTGVNSLSFEAIDIQATSKEITARINNSNNTSTISTITFPPSWRWASGAMPSGLAAGVVAVLWIKNITSTEVLADWTI